MMKETKTIMGGWYNKKKGKETITIDEKRIFFNIKLSLKI